MKKPYIIAIDDDLSVLRAVERDLKAKFEKAGVRRISFRGLRELMRKGR